MYYMHASSIICHKWTRDTHLAQQPKDHEASKATSGQAERHELNGINGGWVRPGSHFFEWS